MKLCTYRTIMTFILTWNSKISLSILALILVIVYTVVLMPFLYKTYWATGELGQESTTSNFGQQLLSIEWTGSGVRWSITSACLQQPRGPGNHQKVVSFEQQSLLIDIWTGQDPLQAAAVPQKQASRRTMSIQGELCQTWKPATWLKKKIATVCKIIHLADHPKKISN